MAATAKELTPEHIATLVDMAERIQARRAKGPTPGVVVRSTGMSAEERAIAGARNDLRSAQVEYDAAAKALARAQDAQVRAHALLQWAGNRLAGLVGE